MTLLGKTAQEVLERMCEVDAQVERQRRMIAAVMRSATARLGVPDSWRAERMHKRACPHCEAGVMRGEPAARPAGQYCTGHAREGR